MREFTHTTRHFLLCGLIRNGAKHLIAEIDRLTSAFDPHGRISWLVVESDSSDQTPKILKDLANNRKNFIGISLGQLEPDIPDRIDRIAYCRNTLLDRIAHEPSLVGVTHVAMADLDGVNCKITAQAVETCWAREDWDVVCANQSAPYYDIYALRHPEWMPGDCWRQCEYLQSNKRDKYGHMYATVLSRMIRIDPAAEWIEVESAFGGLAIYKREAMDARGGVRYSSRDVDGRSICEHISVHSTIRDAGGRIFINPSLINASYTEHSMLVHPVMRLKRNLRNLLFHPVVTIMR